MGSRLRWSACFRAACLDSVSCTATSAAMLRSASTLLATSSPLSRGRTSCSSAGWSLLPLPACSGPTRGSTPVFRRSSTAIRRTLHIRVVCEDIQGPCAIPQAPRRGGSAARLSSRAASFPAFFARPQHAHAALSVSPRPGPDGRPGARQGCRRSRDLFSGRYRMGRSVDRHRCRQSWHVGQDAGAALASRGLPSQRFAKH